MRVLALLSVTAALFGFASADCENACCPAPAAPVADVPAASPETQPTEKKKKEKSVEDEIKALGLRPCSVSAIMGRWKSGKIEKKLKTWAEGGAAPDFEDAKKTGLNLAGMAKLVEWNKNKHRNTDPKAHDQLIAEFEASSKKLAQSAGAKDAEGVKAAAGDINRQCSDCHSRFK
jgi:hypothetical protein